MLFSMTDKHWAVGFPQRQYVMLAEHLMRHIIKREGKKKASAILRSIGQEVGRGLIAAAIEETGRDKLELDDVLQHILPNAAGPIIVTAALVTGAVMLLESGLSFLGIGVAPPLPSWGNMIADAKDHMRAAPWSVLAPGLAIGLVVTACAAVGDGLRAALDPRRSGRRARLARGQASLDLSAPMSPRSPAGPRSHS